MGSGQRWHVPNLEVHMCIYGCLSTSLQTLIGRVISGFEELCQVEADLSGLKNSLRRKPGVVGPYDALDFDIVIQLGGTELCAHIEWVEGVS